MSRTMAPSHDKDDTKNHDDGLSSFGNKQQKTIDKKKIKRRQRRKERHEDLLNKCDKTEHLRDWGFTDTFCHHCGKKNSEISGMLMQCGRCKLAYYCSTKCFNEALPEHSKFCKTESWTRDPVGTKIDTHVLTDSEDDSHVKSYMEEPRRGGKKNTLNGRIVSDENDKNLPPSSSNSYDDQVPKANNSVKKKSSKPNTTLSNDTTPLYQDTETDGDHSDTNNNEHYYPSVKKMDINKERLSSYSKDKDKKKKPLRGYVDYDDISESSATVTTDRVDDPVVTVMELRKQSNNDDGWFSGDGETDTEEDSEEEFSSEEEEEEEEVTTTTSKTVTTHSTNSKTTSSSSRPTTKKNRFHMNRTPIDGIPEEEDSDEPGGHKGHKKPEMKKKQDFDDDDDVSLDDMIPNDDGGFQEMDHDRESSDKYGSRPTYRPPVQKTTSHSTSTTECNDSFSAHLLCDNSRRNDNDNNDDDSYDEEYIQEVNRRVTFHKSIAHLRRVQFPENEKESKRSGRGLNSFHKSFYDDNQFEYDREVRRWLCGQGIEDFYDQNYQKEHVHLRHIEPQYRKEYPWERPIWAQKRLVHRRRSLDITSSSASTKNDRNYTFLHDNNDSNNNQNQNHKLSDPWQKPGWAVSRKKTGRRGSMPNISYNNNHNGKDSNTMGDVSDLYRSYNRTKYFSLDNNFNNSETKLDIMAVKSVLRKSIVNQNKKQPDWSKPDWVTNSPLKRTSKVWTASECNGDFRDSPTSTTTTTVNKKPGWALASPLRSSKKLTKLPPLASLN